ncbi:MAG: TonB-dependent receptor [Bacteroidales bacterium]|nr:TonB-dependent receptor [Bacteroidales bacterium]
MRITFLLSFLLILSLVQGVAQNGTLKGRVFNVKNNEPLPFTNIIIAGTTIGSVSDMDGNFLFTGLNPGYIKLTSTAVGFENVTTEEILITNAKTVFIDIPMLEKPIQLSKVEIKASVFKRVEESPVSLKSLGISEIEKSPGANRDISKVIQSLPGVASSVSFRNDIIVRGGGPSENKFLLDGIEIPNLNHFATQGASGGPVGIINTDFLREVDLYTGAFPASRGNALSSVLDMKLIDGNPDKVVYRATLGASEAALSANGPLTEKTSFLLSVRRSYLQFLFSAIGLPFLPTFNDYQVKVKTKFNQKNELTIISIGALDKLKLNMGIKEPTEDQQFILDYLPVNNQWNYAIGAVYRHYRKNSYGTFVLSRNMLNNEAFKYESNEDDNPDKLNLQYTSQEIENKARYEDIIRKNGYKVTIGGGIEQAKYNNNTFQRVFIPMASDTITSIRYNSELDFLKWNLFSQVSRGYFGERLNLSLGVRLDASTYSDQMMNPLDQFSPRFSASYSITEKFRMNFNAGRYFQLPSYTMLGFRASDGKLLNKANGITYIQADHLVAGIEYQRNPVSKLTFEGFYKWYSNYPFSVKDSVSIASKPADFGVYGNEEVTSSVKGKAYGLEVYYKDKIMKNVDLTVSYTLVRSSSENSKGEYIPSAWDNRHIINVTGFANLGKNWEIGMKWRFVGGAPYTPYDLDRSSLISAWNVQGQGYFDYQQYNTQRLSGFHQLDLRVDKEFFFKKWSLNIYLDIQNLYNFKSEGAPNLVQVRDASGIPLTDPEDPSRYQLKYLQNESGTVLPAIGIIVEI